MARFFGTKNEVMLRVCVDGSHYEQKVHFPLKTVLLTGPVEVVSTCSRQPNLITCYSIIKNYIIYNIFYCFQLESRIKKNMNFFKMK